MFRFRAACITIDWWTIYAGIIFSLKRITSRDQIANLALTILCARAAREQREKERERERKRQFAHRARGNIIRRRHVQHIVKSPAGPARRDFAFVHYVMPRASGVSVECRGTESERVREWEKERERERKKNCRSIRGGEWNPTVEMACFIAFPKIYCREIATPGLYASLSAAAVGNTGLTIIIGWPCVIRWPRYFCGKISLLTRLFPPSALPFVPPVFHLVSAVNIIHEICSCLNFKVKILSFFFFFFCIVFTKVKIVQGIFHWVAAW